MTSTERRELVGRLRAGATYVLGMTGTDEQDQQLSEDLQAAADEIEELFEGLEDSQLGQDL